MASEYGLDSVEEIRKQQVIVANHQQVSTSGGLKRPHPVARHREHLIRADDPKTLIRPVRREHGGGFVRIGVIGDDNFEVALLCEGRPEYVRQERASVS